MITRRCARSGVTRASYASSVACLLRRTMHGCACCVTQVCGDFGYGFWAIEEKASGRVVGDIGYMDVKRGLTPTLDGMPEIGWALASDAQVRGYASEALFAVL